MSKTARYRASATKRGLFLYIPVSEGRGTRRAESLWDPPRLAAWVETCIYRWCNIELNAALESQLAEVISKCFLESTPSGGATLVVGDNDDLNSMTPEGVRQRFDRMTDGEFVNFIINYFEAEYEEGNYFSERLKAIRNVHFAVVTQDPTHISDPQPENWSTDKMSERANRGRRLGDTHLRLVRNDTQEGTDGDTQK